MDGPRPARATTTSGCPWGPSRYPRARDPGWWHTRRGRGRRRRPAARRWPRISPAAVSAWRSSSGRSSRASRSANRWCRRPCCCCGGSACSTPSSAAAFRSSTGATFHEQETDLGTSFYFLKGMPWARVDVQRPARGVRRDPARPRAQAGVHVVQPATVQGAAFDADGVTLEVERRRRAESRTARGFLVDASGRDSFLASRSGQRTRVAQPRQGVAVRVLPRRRPLSEAGRGQRPHLPLRRRLVLVDSALPRPDQHRRGPARPDRARVRQARPRRSTREMVQRCCHRVRDHLGGAERTTPVYRTANFAYTNSAGGGRSVPARWATRWPSWIRSSPAGSSSPSAPASLAAEAIVKAFADGRFAARRFAGYERAVWRGVAPFFTFINKYYEPAFMDLFLKPTEHLRHGDRRCSTCSRAAPSSRCHGGCARRCGCCSPWPGSTPGASPRGLPVESRLEW